MVVILVHVGKNLIEDMLLHGGSRINIVIKNLWEKLSLLTPRLAPYILKMAYHTFTKLVRLIWDLKIHIHGIPYVVTFIVMYNSVLDSNYSRVAWML
jgi:hypothetical protein